MSDFGNEVSIKYVLFCKIYFLKDFALRNKTLVKLLGGVFLGGKLYREVHFPREETVL